MSSLLPPAMTVFERGWLSSNNILFVDGDDTALVDSGYATHAAQTVALVEHALQGRPLRRLFNTHLHSDHCGGNAALQLRFGCETAIPALEADSVRHWNENTLSYKATGQQCPAFVFDHTLAPGDSVQLGGLDWQVLAAPGHDPHSLIFYCPAHRILISADALWEHGFGVIFPELAGEPGFAEARATLDLIATLPVDVVVPGHGAPFTDAAGALARAYSRLAYLSADPVRNAQNAVKVMLKFVLLERRAIALDAVPALLADMSVIAHANRRYLHLEPQALAQYAVSQLVRAGAARIAGAMLHDAA
ncbi:MAG TPA: MBL fold metallo-hydrolase [Burkholderiaceae bacterium]